MPDALDRFAERLESEWLPDFCSAPKRNLPTEGFVRAGIAKLSEHDAYWFMRAIDENLVESREGQFRAARSAALEQIFWSGLRTSEPRTITLWIEPVITIGALARLHHEHGWPLALLGMQSKTWAFDLVGYDHAGNERLACEVKKNHREIDQLVSFMTAYAAEQPSDSEPLGVKQRNAYRKVKGIRRS